MLTFQHISTARHRGERNCIDVMLYGRQADGTSTAIRVRNISAYGYTTNVVHPETVRKWVRWILAIQMVENKCKRYKEEHNETMPASKICSFFVW